VRKLRISLWLVAAGVIISGPLSVSGAAFASAAGTYNFVVNGNPSGTMTISSAGTWSDSWTNGTVDSGTWKKNYMMQIMLKVTISSGGDVGCVFHGRLNKTGISTAAKPGRYVCPSDVNKWYAVTTTSG